MPIPLDRGPGVYIQELQNPVKPIAGVPTSVAAFYGQAPQGIVDYPYPVNSWGDYEAEFGGLDTSYPMSYAVNMFFLNGGSTALVVRYNDPAVKSAAAKLSTDTTLVASSPGAWAEDLTAVVDTNNLVDTTKNQFNLTISKADGTSESYPGVNLTKGTPQYLATRLVASRFVDAAASTIGTTVPTVGDNKTLTVKFTLPTAGAAGAHGAAGEVGAGAAGAGAGAAGAGAAGAGAAGAGAAGAGAAGAGAAGAGAAGAGAAGGGAAGAGGGAAGGGAGGAAGAGGAGGGAGKAAAGSDDTTAPVPLGNPDLKTGIYALLKADIFNILCLPVDPLNTYLTKPLEDAAAFCAQQRAMLIVDPPSNWNAIPLTFSTITAQPQTQFLSPSANAAVYYPNLVMTDDTGASFTAGPCGAVAGVWAATDSSRGVWKAPAGTAATITGITGFTAQVDDGESGIINPVAVNGLRTRPAVGAVVWGARTTVGADQAENQWKYLPVRRLALYIEESVRRGSDWVVFEPNDAPLWSSVRLNVTAFMQGLFRQGAFAGSTPAQAYLVQCDAGNNPPDQVALGIVNILVGFAPLYPAEFVIISIQQQAGQA